MSFRSLWSTTVSKRIEAKIELVNVGRGLAEQAKTIVMVEPALSFARRCYILNNRYLFFQGKPNSRIKSGKLFDIILGPLCPAKA